MKLVKVISEEILSDGFVRLSNYELQIPGQKTGDYLQPVKREILHCTDSVIVLIYIPAADGFVLCKEFRSGVFFNKEADDPFIFECVAGMIDKDKTPEETASAEVLEETGLKPEFLKHIASVYSSPGRMTEKTHLFYTEIEEATEGFYGIQGEEDISTHIISRKDIYKMMDAMKIIDSMTLLALNWFRANNPD